MLVVVAGTAQVLMFQRCRSVGFSAAHCLKFLVFALMAQQVFDEPPVWRLVVSGDMAGFFQSFASVFLLQRDQPENGPVGLFRMRLTFQQ